MRLSIYIFLLFAGITGILFSGCSATSIQDRYSTTKPEQEKEQTRYSPTKDQPEKTQLPDSLDYYDDDEFDEEPDDEDIDISHIIKRLTDDSVTDIDADRSDVKEKLLMEIIRYLNTPYRFGGSSFSGIDCSAFTQILYSNVLSLSLLRSAREQYTQGVVIDSRRDLKFGDLVFFNTRRGVRPGHVGIFIGDDLFAHASRKLGVTISSLSSTYYDTRYMGARRVTEVF